MNDGRRFRQPLVASSFALIERSVVFHRLQRTPVLSFRARKSCGSAAPKALEIYFKGGFRKVRLRGDTDFSQTAHLDRWDADERVRFLFDYDDNTPNLVALADALPERAWRALQRPPRYEVQTQSRQRSDNGKEAIVVARQFENRGCAARR